MLDPRLPAFLALLPDPTVRSLGGGGPDLTRYLLVCGGLVLAVAVLGFAFRRLMGRALGIRAARRSLQVMDVLPLGGKQKLAVVRCYDRTFLLGLGDREVRLVSELDAAIAPAREPAPAQADAAAFAEALRLEQREPASGVGAVRPAPVATPVRPALFGRAGKPRPRPASAPAATARRSQGAGSQERSSVLHPGGIQA